MNDENTPSQTLRVGAGRTEIELPAELFPTEGFYGVHDPLHARALLLSSGETKVAFVSLELTSLPAEVVITLQEMVGKVTGLSPENVWISVTHTFSAPHFLPQHVCKTVAEQQKNDLLFQAIQTATNKAVTQAVADMSAARFGYGTGVCDVNVNRDLLTAEGGWLGCNETGPSDKTVSVLRFETLQGQPLAILFSYGVQPSVMDGVQMTAGGRLVSADLAGAAARFLEQMYGDEVPVLFFLGAAGDQAPALKARYQYVNKDRHLQMEDIHEQGFILAEMLGKRLGQEVLQVAEKIACQPFNGPIFIEKEIIQCPGQKNMETRLIRPTQVYTFLPAEKRDEPVHFIRLGEVVLVGARPELNCLTAMHIKKKSPFPLTIVLTMVNGGAKYMPERRAYDRITYEAMNSPFARGSAELFSRKVLSILRSQALEGS